MRKLESKQSRSSFKFKRKLFSFLLSSLIFASHSLAGQLLTLYSKDPGDWKEEVPLTLTLTFTCSSLANKNKEKNKE